VPGLEARKAAVSSGADPGQPASLAGGAEFLARHPALGPGSDRRVAECHASVRRATPLSLVLLVDDTVAG